MALSRLANWLRSLVERTSRPVGLLTMRTAVSTLFTFCRINYKRNFLLYRQHGHGRSRRMHSAVFLCCRNSLYSMHARFVAHFLINVFAFYFKTCFFVAIKITLGFIIHSPLPSLTL